MMEDPPTKHHPSSPMSYLMVYDTKQAMAFAYGFMTSSIFCILLILLSDPYGRRPSSSSSSSSSPNWHIKENSSPTLTHLFPNSSQSFASPVLCHPPNGTHPIKTKGLGVGKEIQGGLRVDQNITDTNTSTNPKYTDTSNTINTTNANRVASTNANNNVTSTKAINADTSNAIISSTNASSVPRTYNANSVTSTNDSNGIEMYEHIESLLKCDLFDGKWVKDDSYPLYPHASCAYIAESYNCFINGRPDTAYERYRWQPKHCNIPRLKGKDILELIRGKRLVFVGDSLNRQMWTSLMCILKNSVEDQSMISSSAGRHKFKDYNCSVEFFWSPFLVHEWKTPMKRLSLDLMDMKSHKYKDADILIFNSKHWWTDAKTSNGQNYYQQGGNVYSKLDEFRAYRRGMLTWGKWVDTNLNRINTQVFFRGASPTHFGGGKWNSGGRCDWATEPIEEAKYLSDYPEKMKILESVMKRMRTRVHYLNITRLTAFRKDAHPAAYRKANLTEKERRDPRRFQDCSHWCLPGVPDTWNEIFHAQLLINHYQNHKQKGST